MNCLNYRQGERERLFFRCDRNPALQLKILKKDATKNSGGMFSSVRVIEMRQEMQRKASNEELALSIWEFPVELVPPDIADFMAEKVFVPQWRAHQRRAVERRRKKNRKLNLTGRAFTKLRLRRQ